MKMIEWVIRLLGAQVVYLHYRENKLGGPNGSRLKACFRFLMQLDLNKFGLSNDTSMHELNEWIKFPPSPPTPRFLRRL